MSSREHFLNLANLLAEMTNVFVILIGSLALATSNSETDFEAYLRTASYLTVKTSNGYVQGVLEQSCRTEKLFAAFRGIPYAEPPVGHLRFRDPVPRRSWDGIWNAMYQRSPCMQVNSSVPLEGSSEDCLYLNVFTPNLRYLKYGLPQLKAVMVFIHPGAFTTGDSGEEVFSPDFLIDQDVVLVTFNYRLGALGFLSLQNEYVPGNAGLKDQNLVLKWVKENIRKFGGDPSRVTIFGQSAGSASVNYHMLSKSSAGLFKHAIMQSGAAIAPWGYVPPELALKKGMNLAKLLGCRKRKPEDTLKCLQEVPAEMIEKVQEKSVTLQEYFTLRIIAFQPTTEPDLPGAFLSEHPYDVMESGNFTKVPTIIGLTTEEGFFVMPEIKKVDPYGILLSALGVDLSRFVPYNFKVRPFTKAAAEAHREISRFYFGYRHLSKSTLRDCVDLLTDTMFTLPIQVTAGLLAEKSVPVYNYLFSYDGGYNIMKIAQKETDTKGVFHGDDLGYLFYVPQLHTNCSRNTTTQSQDEIMINWMTEMWANFAKTGNPNLKNGEYGPTNWMKFTKSEPNYLDIGKKLVPSNSLKLPNVLFWENLLTRLVEMALPRSRHPGLNIWKILL